MSREQVHAFRADATNSNALQSRKLHVLELSSLVSLPNYDKNLFLDEDGQIDINEPWVDFHVAGPERLQDYTNVLVQFADVQYVPDPFGGLECLGLVTKQMRSLGATTWDEADITRTRVVTRFPNGQFTQWCHLRIFLAVSDQGPDQKGSHKHIKARVSDTIWTWYARNWCFLHSNHLIVGKQLRALKTTWSSLAKGSHLWRSSSSAAKLYNAWLDLFGKERADLVARKLPPRPIKIRWGNVSDLDKHFLRAGKEECCACFKRVFAKTGKKRKAENSENTAVDESEVSLLHESSEAYSQKTGKWAKDVLESFSDPDLWCRIVVGHLSRTPLSHSLHWWQKGGPRPSKIIDFVCEHGTVISQEWDFLLSPEAFHTAWAELWRYAGDDDAAIAKWTGMLVELCLLQAGEWHWRSKKPANEWPLKLMWMVRSPHDADDERRRGVAKDQLALLVSETRKRTKHRTSHMKVDVTNRLYVYVGVAGQCSSKLQCKSVLVALAGITQCPGDRT